MFSLISALLYTKTSFSRQLAQNMQIRHRHPGKHGANYAMKTLVSPNQEKIGVSGSAGTALERAAIKAAVLMSGITLYGKRSE